MLTALSLLEGDYISFKDSFPGDGDRCIVRFPDGSKLDVVLKLPVRGDVSLVFYTDLVIPEGMADLIEPVTMTNKGGKPMSETVMYPAHIYTTCSESRVGLSGGYVFFYCGPSKEQQSQAKQLATIHLHNEDLIESGTTVHRTVCTLEEFLYKTYRAGLFDGEYSEESDY